VSNWLLKLLKCVHGLVAQRRVRFTLKARQELAMLGAGLDEEDACDVLPAWAQAILPVVWSRKVLANGCTSSSAGCGHARVPEAGPQGVRSTRMKVNRDEEEP